MIKLAYLRDNIDNDPILIEKNDSLAVIFQCTLSKVKTETDESIDET